MKEICFVIPCKNKNSAIIEECLRSIRRFYKFADIHIVDSDSKDKQGILSLENKYNFFFHDIKNTNYSTGAIWYIFDKFTEGYENYFLIHDSATILGKVKNLQEILIAPIMSGELDEETKWPRITGHTRTNKFALEEFEKNNLPFTEDFVSILGPMFLIKSKILKEIKQTGFYSIRPRNKYESECMERMWGVIFCHLGYRQEILDESLLGRFRQAQIPDNIGGLSCRTHYVSEGDTVRKHWIKRS